MILRAAAVLVATVALAGCSVGQDSTGDPTAAPSQMTPTPTSTGEPTPMPTPTSADDASAVAELAVTALADQLQVEPSTIEVLQAEAVTWPDTALGCPQPGQSYAQVLTDGYRIALQHDSRVYMFHAGPDGEPFLCPSDERDGGYDFVPPPGFDT